MPTYTEGELRARAASGDNPQIECLAADLLELRGLVRQELAIGLEVDRLRDELEDARERVDDPQFSRSDTGFEDLREGCGAAMFRQRDIRDDLRKLVANH